MWKVLLMLICFIGLPFWLLMRMEARSIKRGDQEDRERERRRTMLYEGLTVDEAQAIIWGWEEMTEEERAALPLTRRVEIRKIREDLAAHKKKWGLK